MNAADHQLQEGNFRMLATTHRIASTATTLIIVSATVGLGGCKGKDGGGAEPVPAAVTVGVAEIVSDYKANEVRGDAKYKGKRVQVTGIVGDIKKNAFDQIYVTLGTGKQFEIENAHCNFPKALTDQAAALDKGASITVDCKCEGRILTSVNLQDCKLVGTPAAGAVAAKEATSSTKAASAEDVCKKLEGAGIAKGCAKTESGAKFDVLGMPAGKGGGTIVGIADEAVFGKFLAGLEASPATSPLRPFYASQKANIIVTLPKGVVAAMEARAKGIVDAL